MNLRRKYMSLYYTSRINLREINSNAFRLKFGSIAIIFNNFKSELSN